MAEHIQEGTEVWLKMPYGSFCIAPEADMQTVLIAGGSGITPFVSFLEQACDSKVQNAIRLFYGVRTRKHMIFESIIRECETRLPDFKVWLFLESEKDTEGLAYRKSSLRFELIWDLLQRPDTSTYYLSGPLAMLTSFSSKLAEKGVSSENIRTDDWK